MNQTDIDVLRHVAATGAPQTSAEIAGHCETERSAVSRSIYGLRNDGLIEIAGERPGKPGQGSRPLKTYAITPTGISALAEHAGHEAALHTLRQRAQRQARLQAPEPEIPAREEAPGHCPTCNRDDDEGACAYPGEAQPGCLQGQPAHQQAVTLAADLIRLQEDIQEPDVSVPTDADPVVAELCRLDHRALFGGLPAAAEHALRLRVLADTMARLVGHGDQTVAADLWLRQLADLFDPEAP